MNDNYNEEVINKHEMVEIKRGLRNVRNDKVESIEQVAKELGIILR